MVVHKVDMPQKTVPQELGKRQYHDKDIMVVLGIHAGVRGKLEAIVIYVYSQLYTLQCMYALNRAVLYRRHRLFCAATDRLAAQLTAAIFLLLLSGTSMHSCNNCLEG